ncbi:hypothetical protein ACFU6S_10850 [Streptomyces sp. NPDC057456]|uniref:hypothetical protein n=1 Tax=Streptomyces sp. NPDC057456 TaxID=3346139 RepID=UPI0036B0E577
MRRRTTHQIRGGDDRRTTEVRAEQRLGGGRATEVGASPLAPAAAALEHVTDQFSAALGGRTDVLAATG